MIIDYHQHSVLGTVKTNVIFYNRSKKCDILCNVNVFTNHLTSYTTQIINPLLTLRLSANQDKGLRF